MSLLKKIASNSSKPQLRSSSQTSGYVSPTKINWQCKYCGSRTGTWSNSSQPPKPGICLARGKVNNISRPHDWRKI